MKIFTTSGRKIKRQASVYDRFINIQLQLGLTHREARKDWKLFTISLNQKSTLIFNN